MKAQLPRIAPSSGVLVWEVAMSAESTDRPRIFLHRLAEMLAQFRVPSTPLRGMP
jgi:hypothetical protein